jgi:hypothetical protein
MIYLNIELALRNEEAEPLKEEQIDERPIMVCINNIGCTYTVETLQCVNQVSMCDTLAVPWQTFPK